MNDVENFMSESKENDANLKQRHDPDAENDRHSEQTTRTAGTTRRRNRPTRPRRNVPKMMSKTSGKTPPPKTVSFLVKIWRRNWPRPRKTLPSITKNCCVRVPRWKTSDAAHRKMSAR